VTAGRVRALPLAQTSEPRRRHLPLAADVHASDLEARPEYVVWELTLKCDLSCRHCGSRAGKARANELTTREALDLVDQISRMGAREITLIGGEAYLHEGWLEIAAAIARAGMTVGIVTGGQGMTRERAARAREAGVSAVSVSVDGLEALHDRVRNKKGSYRAALCAIESVKAEGLRVSANTQITRAALREVEPLFDTLVRAGIEAWQVSMTVPMGRAADDPDLLLQPYQVLEVLPMLARIHARAAAAGVMLFPGNDIGYFGPYESLLRAGAPGGHRPACSAGRATLGVEADGAIKGCPSLPSRDYVGGSIRDATLEDIWQRAEPLRFTRRRTVESLWGFCRTCYYAEPCLGGCSWTAHVLFGKPGNNPYCHHRALELLSQGKRERVVQVARAEGAPFDHGRFECVVEDFPDAAAAQARAIAATGEGFLDF
jgi:radical SAM protein with 4Fe4S-binding SPASM domain